MRSKGCWATRKRRVHEKICTVWRKCIKFATALEERAKFIHSRDHIHISGKGPDPNAKIAQLVERHLAKVEVAGSNPVFRSKTLLAAFFCFKSKQARVVELVDTPDLKSCGLWAVRVQVPPRVQKQSVTQLKFNWLRIFD